MTTEKITNAKADLFAKRILLIAHHAKSTVNFRSELIRDLVLSGYDVFVLAPDYNGETRAAVRQLGAWPTDCNLARAALNPFRDIWDLLRMVRLISKLKPKYTFAYTIKPVVYGSIAAFIARVPKRFAMIEGGGYVFTEMARHNWRKSILRFFVRQLYKVGLSCVEKVFVLNPDDLSLFAGTGMVRRDKVTLLDGIGVDLEKFRYFPPNLEPITFLIVARLLREKGLYEFVGAARLVHSKFPEVRFIAVGGRDKNPAAITESELTSWKEEGIVEFTGEVDDVVGYLRRASVFVLPSYREGLPRSTQEAMATGRAIISTNVPGCRETVENGKNGFLVQVRDTQALANAMLEFVADRNRITTMGSRSREMAERRFNVKTINLKLFQEMGL